MFLMNLTVIAEVGLAWGQMYEAIMKVQGVYPALGNVMRLLNLPTDVPQRMALNRDRRRITKAMRATLLTQSDNLLGLPVDNLCLRVKDTKFAYGGHFYTTKGEMLVKQGTLVALV